MFPLLGKIWDGFPDHLGGLENSKIYDHLGFPTNKIPGGALQEFLGGDVPLGAWNP